MTRGFTVGGGGSFRGSISSSSSMEGKLWVKSVRLKRAESCGEEDVEDVGDGGPKLDAGIRV